MPSTSQHSFGAAAHPPRPPSPTHLGGPAPTQCLTPSRSVEKSPRCLSARNRPGSGSHLVDPSPRGPDVPLRARSLAAQPVWGEVRPPGGVARLERGARKPRRADERGARRAVGPPKPSAVGFRISRCLLTSRPRRSTPSGGFAAAILPGGGPGGGRRDPLPFNSTQDADIEVQEVRARRPRRDQVAEGGEDTV